MKTILTAISVLLFLGCSKVTVDNSVVSNFDLNRFLGRWYEIARFDHYFEKDLQNTTAEYTLRDDGKIDVLNTGTINGKKKISKGVAKTTKTTALLRVSFFGPFYSDYRVLFLDNDYSYALIGSNSNSYLWLLSRSKNPPENDIEKMITEARRRGYQTEKLIWVKHEN